MTFYSFALNYHFDKYNPFGYHLLNIIIHIINALLIYLFVHLLLKSRRIFNTKIIHNANLIAFSTGLLFLTHPLQTQAVSYITQRFASLATLFYLMSVCFYMKGRISRKWVYFLLCVLSMLIAMFTKQISFTLPVIIILIEVLFFYKKETRNKKKMTKCFVFLFLVSFFFIIPSFFNFSIKDTIINATFLSGSHEYDRTTFGNYFLTQFRVIPTYLKLFVYPIGQNLDYDFALSKTLFEAKTFFGCVGLLLMGIFGLYQLRRNVLLGFGILWFFISISVTSSFIPIHHVIFEHRMYLPLVGICLSVIILLFNAISSKRLFIIVMTIIIGVLSLLTIKRNLIWKTEISLWSDVVIKSPHKAKPHSNLGTVHYEKGHYEKAFEMFDKAIQLSPRYSRAYSNRAATYIKKNKPDLAIQDLNMALSLGLEDSKVYNNRGDAYKAKDLLNLALIDYNRAIELNPLNPRVYDNRGTLYVSQGKTEEALADFDKAIAIRPSFSEPYNNRGVLYLRIRQYDKAEESFLKSIQINKHNSEAYNNLGLTYLSRNQDDRALPYLEKALKLRPNYPSVLNNLGIIYGKKGQLKLALKQFNRIKELSPSFVEAYTNSALAYRRLNDFSKAMENYDEAILLDKNPGAIYYNRSLCFFDMQEYFKAQADAYKARALGYNVSNQYFRMLKGKLSEDKEEKQ